MRDWWVGMYDLGSGGEKRMKLAVQRFEAGQCPTCGKKAEKVGLWWRCPDTYALGGCYKGGVEYQRQIIHGQPQFIFRRVAPGTAPTPSWWTRLMRFLIPC